MNRPGCFAEYVVIPAFNAFKLPDAIDDEIAAILDPLGNAVHTALAFDVVGEDVLITGAGPIGIMAAAIVRFVGARIVVITDVNDYRLDLARKMGATLALNVTRDSLDDAMKQLGMQEGFDVGLEMSGNAAAFRDMLRTLHHGGSIAMLGIPPTEVAIDWNEVILKGLTIKGIYGRQMFETWYKMAALLQSGLNIRPVITHRFPYTEYQHAFDIMGKGQSGKVVMNWEKSRRAYHIKKELQADRNTGTVVIHLLRIRETRQPRQLRFQRLEQTPRFIQQLLLRRDRVREARRQRLRLQRNRLTPTERRLDVLDLVVLAEPCELRRCIQRVLIRAEMIDQPVLGRVDAGPHTALRDSIDVVERFIARRGDVPDELGVRMLDRRLQNVLGAVRQRSFQPDRVCQRRGADAVDGDTELVERVLDGRKNREHADRSRQRGGACPDLVGIHRDVVTAGSRDAAHGRDHLLASLAQAHRSRGE